MLQITGKTILLTRGDTAYITFVPRIIESGEPRALVDGDRVVFRLKSSKTLVEIQCNVDTELNKIILDIEPEHTQNLDFGYYKYEVELITALDEHFTFIADSVFEIGRELENHGN